MLVAESIEPVGSKPNAWTVRIKDGIEFHNGKTVTADDVIFSLKRITDPKDPKVGNSSISYIDRDNLKKIDERTVRIPLKLTNAAFPDDLGQYFNAIVPTDYDPKKPVGTGPFKYQSFTPGQRSVFVEVPELLARAASPTSTSWSSSTSPTTRRASTRCSAARSRRSTTCRPRRSRALRATRGSRS